jgi:hypothetical protein
MLQRLNPKKKMRAVDEGFDNNKYFGFDLKSLERAIEEAFLGYMTVDIIEPPEGASWGQFNNRPCRQASVDDMAASFETHLDNCKNDHSIDVAVDPDWLKNPQDIRQSVNGYNTDQIPGMEFNESGTEAIRDNNLWFLSGNHRRLAARKHVESLKVKLAEAIRELDDVKEGKNAKEIAGFPEGPEERLKQNEDAARMLKEKINNARRWSVRLYNRGTSWLRRIAERWLRPRARSSDRGQPFARDDEGDL